MRYRKFWGWGYEDDLLSAEEEKSIEKRIMQTFNLEEVSTIPIPKAEEINLVKPRGAIPKNLNKTPLYGSLHPREANLPGKHTFFKCIFIKRT